MKKIIFALSLSFLLLLAACAADIESDESQNPDAPPFADSSTDGTPDVAQPESENLILGPGTYTVGEDIDPGVYDCIASSGFGVLRGDVASCGPAGFVQTMGGSSVTIGEYSAGVEGTDSYQNLELADGDVIYIEMSLHVEFVPKET